MTARPAAARLPALACVLLAHLVAISAFLILTRRHEPPRMSETESLTWLLLPGVMRPSVPRDLQAKAGRAPVVPRTSPGSVPGAPEDAPFPVPDWSADAAVAAGQEAAAVELNRRQSRALQPPVSAVTTPRSPHA